MCCGRCREGGEGRVRLDLIDGKGDGERKEIMRLWADKASAGLEIGI